MTTDYKNLSLFEAASIAMIAIGIALVGFQVFLSLPDSTQAKITGSFQVLEMSTAAQDIWGTVDLVNDVAFGGMEEFMEEFYIAMGEVAVPVADNVEQSANNFIALVNAVAVASDSIALDYQNNYAALGVEAGMGGRVMGAYFERLVE